MQRTKVVLSQVSNTTVDFGDLDKLGGQWPAGAMSNDDLFRGSRPINST